MKILSYSLLIICFLIALEAILYFLVKFSRRKYQWLITADDELPEFEKQSLQKFFSSSYHAILGWVKKPNTSGREVGRTGQVQYHINGKGARLNPGHEDLPTIISCYGDSFTFSRQVNDDETWEYFLSKLTSTNVLNFGVGNYGLDQAFLRLTLEYHHFPTRIVILSVVPETISRVLNVWKHYNEYGNTFGFKPRYKLVGDRLALVENIINEESKFFNLNNYLEFLQKNDYFYEQKFKKDILRFPYIWSLAKTWKRNIPLLSRLVLKQFYDILGIKQDYIEHLHNISVLRRNISMCAQLYRNGHGVKLMIAILEEFVAFSRKNSFTPIFMFFPQLNDILYIREKGCYYQGFVEEVKKMLLTIDMTEHFMELPDITPLYSHDHYGGHFSKEGNQFVAQKCFEIMKENNLLSFQAVHSL